MHTKTLCLSYLLWFLSAFCQAEIIDKIVAVVEGRIITLSDVRQEREIRRILGEKPASDEALVQQLVEQQLIQTQMADFPGVEVTEEEVDVELRKSKDRDGAAPEAMRQAIRARMRMSRYFDVRFRQFIRASDDEIRKYYEDVFVPEARSRGLNAIPAMASVADRIRENVIAEKLNHDVDNWLESVRRRSDVEIFK